jgi:23S rRNA pseudouridine1911/1915/1917 synthase
VVRFSGSCCKRLGAQVGLAAPFLFQAVASLQTAGVSRSFDVAALRSGFRLAAQAPPKRLKLASDSALQIVARLRSRFLLLAAERFLTILGVPEISPVQTLSVPTEAAGQRLDQWLVTQFPDVSRVRVQQLIEQQKVTLQGAVPKPSLRLRGGETIVVTGKVELPPLHAFPEDIPLDVVFEDTDIAVINKPAGMSVHAGSGKGEAGARGTLVNALLHRFGKLSHLGGELRPGIVHRIDKETSGLLVVAKNDKAHRKLAHQFARRQVKKTYLALVHGWMQQEQGTIRSPIARDLQRRERMTTRRTDGRPAITHWKVLKRYQGKHGKFSLLEVKIETGRTHQIRVHLSSLGHPVVGDVLYGAPREFRGYLGTPPDSASLGRHFLHASALQFEHPIKQTLLSLEQPLPAELKNFLRHIGN